MKKWISAFRLRTLPLAVATVITGCSLGINIRVDSRFYHHSVYQRNGDSSEYLIFGLAVLTAILLQILSNLANDYGDFKKGTDNKERVGPMRAMQSGAINETEMKRALVINSVLALASGLSLLYLSFGDSLYQAGIYLILGLGAIAAALKYTLGKNPYGYKALGDLFVFVFFGLVGVIGSYYLIRLEITLEAILGGVALGCFSVMVLNLNNMRDIINDESSGKITVPVKIGLELARTAYHPFLLLTGWTCMIVLFLYLDLDSMLLIFIPAAIFVSHLKFSLKNDKPALFNPELKKVSLATFGVALAIWLGSALFYNFPSF